MRAQQLAITLASFAALAGALWGSWRCAAALLALLGPAQQVGAARGVGARLGQGVNGV
jgi:hypothetical protein